MTTEPTENPYAYDPSKYVPNMGLKDGRVNEIRSFFHVKPGHEAAIREQVVEFSNMPGRRTLAVNQKVGAHTQVLTLFDNDSRFLFGVDFDTDWDPYIEDSVGLAGIERYWLWWQHLEEFDAYTEDNLPTIQEAKFLMNVSRATAVVHVNAFPHLTVAQRAKQAELWDAFQQVLNDPEGAKALQETPALAPLLDKAAD